MSNEEQQRTVGGWVEDTRVVPLFQRWHSEELLALLDDDEEDELFTTLLTTLLGPPPYAQEEEEEGKTQTGGISMGVGMPAAIWLNKFGVIIHDMLDETAYQVGSSLFDEKDWRDVDVRFI